MKRFVSMDPSQRLSRSLPLLLPPPYLSPVPYRAVSPRWFQRRHPPRHHYIGGVRTTLIGANSYPNVQRLPQRLIVCGAGGSLQKLTRSSSSIELSRSGVFSCSRSLHGSSRRAASCEDVSKKDSSTFMNSRLSESGVSLNGSSHAGAGSDGVTQVGSISDLNNVGSRSWNSFGSCNAVCETPFGSELDRPDSDAASMTDSACGLDVTDNAAMCVDNIMTKDLNTNNQRRSETTPGWVNSGLDGVKDRDSCGIVTTHRNVSVFASDEREAGTYTSHQHSCPICSIHCPNRALYDPTACLYTKNTFTQSSVSLSNRTHSKSSPLTVEPRDQIKTIGQTCQDILNIAEDRKSSVGLEGCKPHYHSGNSHPKVLAALQCVQNETNISRSIPPVTCAALICERRLLNAQQQLPPSSQSSHQQHREAREQVQLLEEGPVVKIPTTVHFQLYKQDETVQCTETERPTIACVADLRDTQSNSKDVEETPTECVTQVGGAGRVATPSSATVSAPLQRGGGAQLSILGGSKREHAGTTDSFPTNSGSKQSAARLYFPRPSADKEKSKVEGSEKFVGINSSNLEKVGLLKCKKHEGLPQRSPIQLSANTRVNNEVINKVDCFCCDETPDPFRLSSTQHQSASLIKREETSDNNADWNGHSKTAQYRAVTCDGRNRVASLADQSGSGRKDSARDDDERTKTGEGEEEGGRSGGERFNSAVRLATACQQQHTCSSCARDDHYSHTVNCSLPHHPSSVLSPSSTGGRISPLTTHCKACQVVCVHGGVFSTRAVQSKHSEGFYQTAIENLCSWQVVISSGLRKQRLSFPTNTRALSEEGAPQVEAFCDGDKELPLPRHSAGFPQAEGGTNSDVTRDHCQGQCKGGFFVNSTAFVKQGEEREGEKQTIPGCHTHQPALSFPSQCSRGQGQRGSHVDASLGITPPNLRPVTSTPPVDTGGDSLVCLNSRFSCAQRGEDSKKRTMAENSSNGFNLLDSLQQQLSLLSSDDSFSASNSQSVEELEQVSYRDHAEASLPHIYSKSVNNSCVSQKSGVVAFKSDKTQWQQQTEILRSVFSSVDRREATSAERNTDYTISQCHGSLVSETRREASFRHSRVSQVVSAWGETVSSDDKGGREGNRGEELVSDTDRVLQFSPQSIQWQPPSSSSEQEDSDGNYTSRSSTESSQYHSPSESELLTSDCEKEDYDNVNTFSEFVSGLQGQFTSDRPSVHYRTDTVTAEFRSNRLRSCIQETILEADDESESADDADTTTTTLSSFRSSFHNGLPQSTPKQQAVLPEIKVWSSEYHTNNLSTSEERNSTMSPVCRLQDLSDRLSTFSDVSFELHTLHDATIHSDLSESYHSPCCSPVPSDVSESSMFSSSATAEVRKEVELATRVKAAESSQTLKMTRRYLAPSFRLEASKKAKWVEDNVLLLQNLVTDLESRCKTSEQSLMEDMLSFDRGRGGDAVCSVDKDGDDLYRSFTRETLEKRQNHVCPFVEEHLPVIRFKRFLKKKHNSKLTGHKTFRIRHKLEKVTESPSVLAENSEELRIERCLLRTSQNDQPQPSSKPGPIDHPSAISLTKGPEVVMPSVFIDASDAVRSWSDSAYSTLSELTSRHVSDLDSTSHSISSGQLGDDVSSSATDLSLDSDKLMSLSDVFEQLDLCEGQIDQALLDRLHVSHYKADTL